MSKIKPHKSNRLHLLAGFIIAVVSVLPCYYLIGFSYILSCAIGVVLAIIAGSVKEWLDRQSTGLFDWLDWLYTVLGAIIFCCIYEVII